MEQVTVLTRCPHCAARVPSEADWCSLCLANLRSAPEPSAATPLAATHASPSDRGPIPVRGRHRKGAPTPAWTPGSIPTSFSTSTDLQEGSAGSAVMTEVAGHAEGDQSASVTTPARIEEVERIATAMLAELAVTERANLGPLANPDISRGRKAAVIAGGATGMAVILLAIFALLGTML